MNKLNITFSGYNDVMKRMTINGKCQKVSKEKNGTCYCTFETEENTAEIVMYKSHYYTSKNWFWWSLLYYFVSIFGLFDVRHDKRCLVVDCRFKINLTENTNLILKPVSFENNGKFLEIQTDASVEETVNKQYFDKEGQRRLKKMKKIKIGLTITILIALIVLIVLLAIK